MTKRGVAWQIAHWAIALAPFVLVLALSVWGYGRYAWVPFVAGVLCPVGAALVGLQVKRDRDERRAR
ncbi:MAG TPA: hypothetical protein VM370_13345 [Candidatus Thermoplasmatota archaeon]|nr:hypothetical protein [Candidatus Thermoplasmatota archaeon]